MIYKKLLEFQKQQIKLIKKGENPHFKSKYVPLNEVLESIVPALNELRIVIVQNPSAEGLTTILYDTEDETQVSSFLPYVEASTAQKLGSNNTYNRRYALVTMLGLGDQDDDGNIASEPKSVSKKKESFKAQEDIPDGERTVTVLRVHNGTKKNGEPFQRVSTGDGAAWNNDKNGLKMENGKTYNVIVKSGGIVQATENTEFDDIANLMESNE